ncbi:MAG: ATP synthase F1 subunit gamma [Balneolaceae bacterium]
MANLRDIRNRISSVENTQQITKAMKMVAAAKLRKAQTRMNETRPYVHKMKEVVGRLITSQGSESVLLRKPEVANRLLMIVVGSDRGLCGAFNNNLFKEVESVLRQEDPSFLSDSSGSIDLVCIGRKAQAYFQKREYQVVRSYPGFFDNLNYPETVEIMQEAMDKFVDATYDGVLLAYNEFKSVITQNRVIDQVLPLEPEKIVKEVDESPSGDVVDYLYEPDIGKIIDQMLPLHLKIQLWSAVLESNASEQGARMAAMDNATENAKELKRDLQLKYNRARQSAITTEISEIVSGAQALKE